MAHAHASSKAELAPSRLFDCSHIVALVTGGATGIGEMAASGLIQGGAKVIIASRKESELKSKAQPPYALLVGGRRSILFVINLTDRLKRLATD